jgi:hypothetical protein
MNNKSNPFIIIFILIFFAAFVYLLYSGILGIYHAFRSLDSNIAIAVVTVSGTILVSTFSVIITRIYQRRHDQEIAHRKKKADLYDEYLKGFFDIFFKTEDKKQTQQPEDLIPFLREFQRKLILWAGPETIIAYAKWHKELTTSPQLAGVMIKMIDFFLSLREDLGHSNKGIKREQLARLFLKNPELLFREYVKNPKITMAALGEIEKNQIGMPL